MENILEIKNLSKQYDGFQLKDVSFSVPKGSIMGLIGENGAGKTTVIKLLLAQMQRLSGEISMFGLDNIRDQKKIKQDIGVVFDENFFYFMLKPKEIEKIMQATFVNWDSKLFHSYLTKFKLPDNKPLKEYSRGMRMKLAIAVAISHHPKLLLLDEATSGLDPVVRGEILDVFLDFIQDEEHSILLSSHITSDLERVADYITFIHDGQIVFSDNKDTIMERYGLAHLRAGEQIEACYIVGSKEGLFGREVLVNDRVRVARQYPDIVIDGASLDNIMTYYVKEDQQ